MAYNKKNDQNISFFLAFSQFFIACLLESLKGVEIFIN